MTRKVLDNNHVGTHDCQRVILSVLPPCLLFFRLDDITKNVITNVQNFLFQKVVVEKHKYLQYTRTFPCAPVRLQNTLDEPADYEKNTNSNRAAGICISITNFGGYVCMVCE